MTRQELIKQAYAYGCAKALCDSGMEEPQAVKTAYDMAEEAMPGQQEAAGGQEEDERSILSRILGGAGGALGGAALGGVGGALLGHGAGNLSAIMRGMKPYGQRRASAVPHLPFSHPAEEGGVLGLLGGTLGGGALGGAAGAGAFSD